jgi:2-polyprenyl-6-methoxyphenol hydroxylase-like FAD-dependent oxidoreductase
VYDADGLTRALLAIRSAVVVHQLTELALLRDPERLEQALANNARLSKTGTSNLVAAVAAGVAHIVAQSIAWVYRPGAEPHEEIVMSTQVEVLVVGAGPVGLSLAAELQRRNISVLVVDRHAAAAQTSRACVIHARTLEVLEPLGVTAQLLQAGVKVPMFRIRDRDRALVSIDFSHIDSVYPFTLMYPQDRTEQLLLAALERAGGRVERPAELTGVAPVDDGMAATLTIDGQATTVESRWLVGCDGMHSTVRDRMGISFDGAAYEEGFVLADVRMDWPLSREEVSLFYSPDGLMVVAPLPDDRYRIVATDTAAPESPSQDYIQALLDTRGPRVDAGRVQEVGWSSRFHIHHRVAQTPRRGRVLLCGDAAHVHSPAGGQGMNTGIQDAMSLAPLLDDVLRGGDDASLDQWAADRHRIAIDVVEMTDRMTRMATLASPVAQSLRNAAVALLGHVPPVRDAVARKLAELDAR